VSLELAGLGDPAIVCGYLCGGVRSVARMLPRAVHGPDVPAVDPGQCVRADGDLAL